jgi:hypothetical protein
MALMSQSACRGLGAMNGRRLFCFQEQSLQNGGFQVHQHWFPRPVAQVPQVAGHGVGTGVQSEQPRLSQVIREVPLLVAQVQLQLVQLPKRPAACTGAG